MKNPQTPSIKFIAEMSHCSAASVSNVINAKGSVGEKTKSLILENIRKYNYRINPSARSLKVRVSETVAIYFRENINLFKSEFYLNLMRGMQKRISENGYDLLLCEQETGPDIKNAIPRFVVRSKADAVVIMNSEISDDMRNILTDYKMPSLMLDSYSPDMDSIASDGFSATGEIVSYLFRMKHRRIAYFGYAKEMRNSETRMNGFLNGARHNGIQDTCKICKIFLSEDEAIMEFDRIFSKKNHPTAVVASTDPLACSLMKHAQDLGFSVPRDISFFGYGNILMSTNCTPLLSTVNVDSFKLGQMGADMIISRIKNPDMPIVQTLFPTKLVLRESVAVCAEK